MDEIMLPMRLISTVRRLTVVGAVLSIFPKAVIAQNEVDGSPPMEVTSDTPEYCLHLLDRVSDLVRLADTPVPREVTDLSTEGHRMCAHGQTRGGIMRLRSALLILEKGDSAHYR